MARRSSSSAILASLRDRRWTEADGRRVLAAQARSGQSVAAFAREHGLDAQRVFWWRRRLGDVSGQDAAESMTFAPVVVTGTSGVAAVVRIGEIEIEVVDPARVAPEWLADLLALASE